jgi:hypothetical protein
MGHGMFRKNMFVEENAGLREKSYVSWEFNNDSILRILAFLIIPGVLYMNTVTAELEQRDKGVGRARKYGIVPLDE